MRSEYRELIARIIRAIDAGRVDASAWRKPWHDANEGFPNVINERLRIDDILERYYASERIKYYEKEQNNSFYSPDADAITLPAKKQFISAEAYYAVKAHETIHSTGEYTRCNRDTFNEFKTFKFGDVRYTREELVAEIGACFLLVALGVNTSHAERNASVYIANWLTRLNNNTFWIYEAAELAEEAVDYILEAVGEEVK